jgi:hypothetical protein
MMRPPNGPDLGTYGAARAKLVTNTVKRHGKGLMPIDPRSKSTDNVDRFYPIGLSKLTVILLGSSIPMINEIKKTWTGFQSTRHLATRCWADKDVPQLKLTWENQDELMDSIPMQELSSAQEDAIIVAKDIGFNYLWNDSLCIRQGDKQG